MQNTNKVLRLSKFPILPNLKRMTFSNFNSITTRPLCISMVTKVFNQFPKKHKIIHKSFCVVPKETELVDYITYDRVCEETLESLTEYVEELLENAHNLNLADASYSSGVLTVNLGEPHGTYVINRQTPNRQIWLSSPTSGPKRYDFDINKNCWIYKHDGRTLHQLLQEEFSRIITHKVDFSKCSHSLI